MSNVIHYHAPSDHDFMNMALDEARLALPVDVPVGAILVKDGKVIAQNHNQRERDYNPVGHAEILVLQAAGEKLGDWRLNGCTLYVTLEPCPMCASAIVQSRVSRVVFGAYDPVAGACGSKHGLLMPSSSVTITGGLMEDACQQELKGFFAQKR
ncbi:MAG: nucleoside deaminase [Vampirovibrionales bacterium]|nr:nucleoside deaminase [Vampirovibrionales bacterium]